MEENNEILNIGIIGLGLIGGSFGRAFLKRTPHRVFGRDLSPATVATAKLVKAVSEELTDETLPLLDVLLLAVNPRTACALLEEVLPFLKAGCIVTDAGGNKRGIAKAMREASELYPSLQFIAAHPMAGKEFSGLKHSVAGLFDGASVLMIPVKAGLSATAKLKNLFTQIGFKNCKLTTAEEHDRMIAFNSQLCHAISSSYCLNSLSEYHDGFSAGSFRDLTRVARLSAPMWSELFCDNSDNLSAVLGEFIAQVTALKNAVEAKDEKGVAEILSAANAKKEAIDKNK